ncbi:MAG: hypothetical protein MJK04_09315 [Psychrosphaera sp.]|nr:hypothetical protein [Psychrosphaera sp.]
MSTKIQLLIMALCFLLVYIIAVFIGAEFNPINWPTSGKFGYLVAAIVTGWAVIDKAQIQAENLS